MSGNRCRNDSSYRRSCESPLKLVALISDIHGNLPALRAVLADIDRRHFNETARLCGLGKDMESIIDDVVERTPRVIDDVGARLPKGFPERVFDVITKGAARAAEGLARGSES